MITPGVTCSQLVQITSHEITGGIAQANTNTPQPMKHNYSVNSPAVVRRKAHVGSHKRQEKHFISRDKVSFWDNSLHKKGKSPVKCI